MRIFVILMVVVSLFSSRGWGESDIFGKISENTRWSGNIRITGDVIVEQGVVLTIEPGTNVVFNAKSDVSQSGKQRDRIELLVLGVLIADGLSGDGQITFTSGAAAQQMHDWYGIIFKTGNYQSLLKNCLIEYGYTGVTCYGSAPRIENCLIQFHFYSGISCEVRARPYIRSSIILGNVFAGINCELFSNPVIENSIITQNGNGVVIYDRSNPDLGKDKAQEGESRGNNHFINNFDFNIYNRSEEAIFTQLNFWNSGEKEEINQAIFDKNRDSTYGEVLFTPFLQTNPIQKAITILAANQAVAKKKIKPASDSRKKTPPAKISEAAMQPPQNPASIKEAVHTAQTRVNTSPVSSAQETPRKEKEITSKNLAAIETPQGVTDDSEIAAATSAQINEGGYSDINPGKVSEEEQRLLDEEAAAALAVAGLGMTASLSSNQENFSENTGLSPDGSLDSNSNAANSFPEGQGADNQFNEQPVIESFLDGGRRQYIEKSPAEYPPAYFSTGVEGIVLMEVLVGRDGRVKNFRVLRSDGEAFTESASLALKAYRYKPGTIQGTPVNFKVIERFEFKLNPSEQ